MTSHIDFKRMFEPRSIAIVGVSRSAEQKVIGGSGLLIMRALLNAGFKGNIYPINPNASEIDGVQVYHSMQSVPEPIDLVIVAVPAAVVPQILQDCIAVGARNVHVCSSGFSETGEEEGRLLEEKIKQLALHGGLHIVGPNCMGIQVPKNRIVTFDNVTLADGSVAFLSQSGGHVRRFLDYASTAKVGFSKMISIGNAAVLNETDFIEYLGSDHDTKVICLYLEGTRNGKLLTSLVRKINLVKPVVVWKGGQTDFGARAAASHTGSLVGNQQIWDAFFKQTGAIQVSSIEEMAEVCAAFIHFPPSSGKRAIVISGGGGNNVAAGDICAEEGIQLLPLSTGTRLHLSKFLSSVNQGLTNPLEAPSILFYSDYMRRAMEIFELDHNVDMVIVSLVMSGMMKRGIHTSVLNCLSDIIRGKHIKKPLVVTLSDLITAEVSGCWDQLSKSGVFWYPTIRQTCRALSKFTSYHEYVKRVRADS